MFIESWRKHQQKLPLQPLERLIAGVIREHPEYQQLIETPEQALEQDFLPDAGRSNPFLHMGMHISLQEQLAADRPAGIAPLFQALREQTGDPHVTEHLLMECLGKVLWEAQQSARPPDEQAYLACARALLQAQRR